MKWWQFNGRYLQPAIDEINQKLELRYTMLLEKVVEPFQKSKLILLETQVKNNLIHSEIAIVPTVAISYFPTPNNRCQKILYFLDCFRTFWEILNLVRVFGCPQV